MSKAQASVVTSEGLTPPGGRPKDDERQTRKPLPFWDRIKFLVLLTAVWFILVWSLMANDPIVGFLDAMRIEVRTGWWVFILGGLELIREVHYLISEHWRGYYRFWTERVFGGINRTTRRRLSDWTRFRLWRVTLWVFWIFVISWIVGKFIHTGPLGALIRGPELIWKAVPLLVYVVFILALVVGQFAALFWFMSRGGIDVYYPDDIKTRFSDVWGQDHVLDRVKENIIFLEHPELVEERGGFVPGGILLWGPPGTGKTLMAEAVAGETGRPYVFVDPGAFINMFMGVGILKVKSLFRKLRRLALRYGGVIVFFDEADSLGNRGGAVGGQPSFSPTSLIEACRGFCYLSSDTQSALVARALSAAPQPRPPGKFRQMIPAGMGMGGGGMGTLQALLTEMSGLKKPRGFFNRVVRRTFGMRPKPPPKYRILIMMATNMPSALDPALLRPGRIDRVYQVAYPSKEGRRRTYEGYLNQVKHDLTPEQIEELATITPYATGATIKDLVNESLIVALRDGRDTITWADVLRAKLLKSVGPSEGVEYVERERHAVAVHEACHAVTSYRVQKHRGIDTATIQKGGDTLGFVQPIPIEEQFTHWRSEFEADMMVSLASIVGERMFFEEDSSSGVSSDLRHATTLALAMEGLWGMGGQYGTYAVTPAPHDAHPVADGQDRAVFETALGKRAEAHLAGVAERAGTLLKENRGHVLALAHALEMHKTISGQDVEAVLEGTQGPIVDGRPYHTEEFAATLESYHQQVMVAHRARGVAMPLPVPVPAGQAAEPVPAWKRQAIEPGAER